jgi:hypothetical protein
MGEAHSRVFEPTFNGSVKVEVREERLTSDAGAVLLREADHRLGLVEALAAGLEDRRDPSKIRYTLCELLRERLYGLALGYAAADDADHLAHDPALRTAVWDRRGEEVIDERLASQPTQSRLVDQLGDSRRNRQALRSALADWTSRFVRATGGDRRVRFATIDVDSFPIAVHGRQEGGAYNGHYEETVYHPLVASFCIEGEYDRNRFGARLGNGFLHAVLRDGACHTAQGSLRFLQNTIAKARGLAWHFDLRLDAGFTSGKILDYLTEEKVRFLGRLTSNSRLDALAQPHLTRPVGRPPREGYFTLVELGPHRAESWRHAQRLILAIVDQPDSQTGQLALFPRYFFLITNYPVEQLSAEAVLERYRQRGTFEDRVGEFNQAIGAHLSSPDFAANEVHFLLALLAFNLASFLRLELEDASGGGWSLERFRDVVLKTGGRFVKHSGRLVLCIAGAARKFWERLSGRLRRWKFPASLPPPAGPQPRAWMPPPPHAHLTLVHRE